MIYSDLHTHTTYCDGRNTPEEMVLKAIEKGLDQIGLLAHSYMYFEPEGSLQPEKTKEFQQEVKRLKEKYKGQIDVLCGIEQDSCSTASTEGFDYIIGSVHYFEVDGKCYAMDRNIDEFKEYVDTLFKGDFYLAAECYFEQVKDVVERTGANIIGHLDMIKKYNIEGGFFDEKHPRYVKAWKSAVDVLIKYNLPFEVNLGGLERKHTVEPYPSHDIIDYIKEKGGKFILTSDSHWADMIGSHFEQYKYLLEE